MPAEISIRPYTAADAPRLGEIFRSAILGSRRHYTAEQRHAWACDATWNAPKWQLRMDGLQPFLAMCNGSVAGYTDVQPSGLIDHFFVDATAHGQGVGKLLMRHALQQAKRMQLTSLHSEVSHNAQGFYAQFGFMPKTHQIVDMGGVKAQICVLTKTVGEESRTKRVAAPDFTLSPCAADDFEAVLALRSAAMRPSLERIDRFDPLRLRERLITSFIPELGQHVVVGGERVGFVTVLPRADHFRLQHLYLQPPQHNTGLGSAVLKQLIANADAANLPMTVGVLDQSDALRFYLRHGFVCTGQSEFDWELARPVTGFMHP